jgi:hypothetical protein
MANTFVKIGSTVSVGVGGSSTISFTSIPSTYTDLCIKLSTRATGVTQTLTVQFNSVTSSYQGIQVYGDGTNIGSSTISAAYYAFINSSASAASLFASNNVYIPNYASSNYKALTTDVVIESDSTNYITEMVSGLWSNTSAISSITVTPLAGLFAQYSTATLYGILKA